jgi:hypothetical protein
VDQLENVGNGSRIIVDYPGRLAGLSLLSACPLRATSSDSEPLVAGRKAGKREAAEVALLVVRRELWSGKPLCDFYVILLTEDLAVHCRGWRKVDPITCLS